MSVVWMAALQQAAKDWYDQGDDLDGARRALAKAEIDQLSPRVRAAATTFTQNWANYIQRLTLEANEHGGSLNAAAITWWASDQTNVNSLQNLLPWDQRDLEPTVFSPKLTSPGGTAPGGDLP